MNMIGWPPARWPILVKEPDSFRFLEETTLGQILLVLLIVLASLLLIQGLVALANTLGRNVPRARFFFNLVATVFRFVVWIARSSFA